ncbi:MAG: hypothetical protein A3E88_07690 [Legionellales bacterium RIFCSPHIGHO2_12_FULL_35_11]|nr:MAG: hypothetical protein A3E88_07690 [Legionellales bacterium RIFCSPHIGHO2_12_FULL_35_11]
MSVYMTEDEQVELLKSWWKKYNSVIIVSISILLLAISGFKFFLWKHEKKMSAASVAYEHMMVSVANGDTNAVKSYSETLISKYGSTVYADAARLTLAKNAVDTHKYKIAKNLLEKICKQCRAKVILDIARIRLARILIQEKDFTYALAELAKVENESYLPIINELKGDISALSGKTEEAVSYYKKAIGGVDTSGIGNLFLEMKSNDIISIKKPK